MEEVTVWQMFTSAVQSETRRTLSSFDEAFATSGTSQANFEKPCYIC